MTTVEQRPTGRPGDAPSGPAGPRPGGPKSPPDYPAEPTPPGPPPRDDATGPRPDTTRPIPTPRPAPGPGRALAALVADAERHGAAWLHLLTTAADDGEFDEAVRRQLNAAANHTACALTRLARIELPARRMPTTAPSGGLGPTPSRSGAVSKAWAAPAGPGDVPVVRGRDEVRAGGATGAATNKPPASLRVAGERLAPGYGAAADTAVTESRSAVVAATAGASAGGVDTPVTVTPGAPPEMPKPLGPPEFQSGAALLRGASC